LTKRHNRIPYWWFVCSSALKMEEVHCSKRRENYGGVYGVTFQGNTNPVPNVSIWNTFTEVVNTWYKQINVLFFLRVLFLIHDRSSGSSRSTISLILEDRQAVS
jgi:hypothetical protein